MTFTRRLAVVSCAAVIASLALLAPAATAAPVTDALDGAAIATASLGSDRIDLFTRGGDGALHWKFYAGGRWSGWEDLGTQITSAPTATWWDGNRLDVFARGPAGQLLQRVYQNNTWDPRLYDLGGQITSAPAVASWGAGRLDIFARGTNGSLYQKFFQRPTWSAWINMQGAITSAPAVVSQKSGSLNVFMRGGNNALYTRAFTGKWSGYSSFTGGTLASSPTAASWADGRVDVFAKDTNGNLIQRYFSGGKWSTAYTNLGGPIASAPAAVSWASGRLDIFSQDTGGALQQKTFQTHWGAQVRLGPLDPADRPIARDSRIVGVQAGPASDPAKKTIEYVYVNNGGVVVQGHQTQVDNTGSLQWSSVASNEAFTGPPAIAVQPDGRAQAALQNINGDITVRGQNAVAGAEFTGRDVGGWMTSAPNLAALPDGRLQMFATDADGTLWTKVQTAANSTWGTWRSLGKAGLVDAPALGATRTGLQLFGLDATGTLKTAGIDSTGLLGAWTTIGSGIADRVGVVFYPGYKLRLFARTTAGAVVTTMSDSAGAFPAWQPVGEIAGDIAAAGPAAAVFSLRDTRTYVIVRGTDNLIHWTRETAVGSGQWESWRSDNGLTSETDPTVVEFDQTSGRTFGYLFKTPDEQPYLFVVDNIGADARAGSAAFTGRKLPALPQ